PIRGCEIIVEQPDGTRLNVVPYPTPLFDESGKLIGAVNMLVDITERKQAEIAAFRLAAIVNSSDDAIVSLTLDGVITSWNRAAERLFGYTAAEVIGQSITIIIPPDRRDEEKHVLSRLREGEAIEHFETVRIRKDGTRL